MERAELRLRRAVHGGALGEVAKVYAKLFKAGDGVALHRVSSSAQLLHLAALEVEAHPVALHLGPLRFGLAA